MGRWSVLVTGGEVTDAVREALGRAGLTVGKPDPAGEGFTVELEADGSARARSRVEAALGAANGFSAGPARSVD